MPEEDQMPFFLRRFNRNTEKAIRIWKLNQLKSRLPAIDGFDKSLDKAIEAYNEMRNAYSRLDQDGISMSNDTIAECKSKLQASTLVALTTLAKLGNECNAIGGILLDIWSLERKIRDEAIPLNEADVKLREIADRIAECKKSINPNSYAPSEPWHTKCVERFWEPYWQCSILNDKRNEMYTDGYCAILDHTTQIKP